VRGTAADLPDVRVITPEEYQAELGASVDEDAGVEDDAGVEEDAEVDSWSRGLALVGLLDPEESVTTASIGDLVDNIAGYYDSERRSITLLDRGRAEDSDSAQALLAHELVHVVQDQQMGLQELSDRTGRSTDSSYARRCLTEGEASLYEDLAISLLSGVAVDPSFWNADLDWSLKHAQGEVASARSPYSRLWLLNYPVGTRFITDAWLSGGNRAVQGLYWAVPQSTIYWMHGYSTVLQREGQLVRPLACGSAAPPRGYELVDRASLGSFAVYAFLVHAFNRDGIAPFDAAWQAALSGPHHSLSVFMSDAGDSFAVSWRILFEDHEVAARVRDQLVEGYEPDVANITAVQRRYEIEILAAEHSAVLSDWQGTAPDACPGEEE
jgi:hypothetical protein